MATVEPTKDRSVNFTELLNEAVSKPGTLMRAYSLFWNYSLGNQILALIQANQRNIPLGPIASFNRWKELGRHVKRGEKAIELCMPVTCKRTVKDTGADGTDVETEITFRRFGTGSCCPKPTVPNIRRQRFQIGRASCRERV